MKLILILITSLSLISCKSETIIPVNSKIHKDSNSVTFVLNKPDNLLQSDYKLDQINTTSSSVSAQIAHQSAAQSAGSIGGGFIAYLAAIAGVSIANSLKENSKSVDANKIVEQLDEIIIEEKYYTDLENIFFKKTAFEQNHATNSPSNTLTLTPVLKFTADLRAIRLHLIIELKNIENKTIYLNEYEYYTIGFEENNDEISLNYWLSMDGKHLKDAVKTTTIEAIELFKLDYNSKRNSTQTLSEAIKYENRRGYFYERGRIISNTDERIIFRSLRGGIKSVEGKLL